ncbi:FAD-dependent oxidoreductase [Mesorhizobium sp.]|uniref:NAD(P)/FAD-dependent oxidoreductase n=1 Tax=Mesorhizobium sp. TaxID=1871066 RepID=UPI00267CFAC7
MIRDEKLAVPFVRNGWIQAAHTETALKAAGNRDRQWRNRGADVRLLSQTEIAALTGAQGYLGGWLDRRAGVIDPLAYTSELARIASAAGVKIAEHQKVVRLDKNAGLWRISTEGGAELQAKAVILATNAYTGDLLPGLAETIVPLHSFQIATAPLPADLAAGILPEGQAVSDSRRILVYYRKSADGRLVLGGRGRMALPTSEGDWAHLERALLRLYPALSGVGIEKRWFGRVGDDAGSPPAYSRARAGPDSRGRLPGPWRRPDDRAWRAHYRLSGERRRQAIAFPGLFDPADTVPRLSAGRRRCDDRLVSYAGCIRALIPHRRRNQLDSFMIMKNL